MKKKELILFDIDGTLIESSGTGLESIKMALDMVFGSTIAIDSYRPGGMNYLQIIQDLLPSNKITKQDIWRNLNRLNRVVNKIFTRKIKKESITIKPLPCAIELIMKLSKNQNYVIGLLTGNSKDMAKIKLRNAGFDEKKFAIQAFGDEEKSRSNLVNLARKRANKKLGCEFQGNNTIIIGDTINDIICARESKAKCVIIATGDDSRETLKAYSPDYLFESLCQLMKFIEEKGSL
jgi:phosphoglycolate phosphatase-like HAD superfamily hydrolase